jgi:membrane protease YdiL (CAAX protease family)
VNRRDDAVAVLVLVVSMVLMARTAAVMPDRWPWIWASWAFALPFLILLAPGVQQAAADGVAGRPAAALLFPAILTIAAILSALLYNGSIETRARPIEAWRLVALPVLVALAFVATGRDRGSEASGWRLLGGALALGLVAALWDRALKIPVPGNTPIGLAFFLAVALGLFLYTAVRPLRTMNVGFVMPARDAGAAFTSFALVVAAAIPLGFAIGFVVWNPRLSDPGFALARLLGLVVFVGIPEEILFRGLVQEGLSRLTTSRAGWLLASLLFGLSHITKKTGLTPEQHEEFFGLNWRYALLATIAGLGYGWVYRRTGRVSAAALTHGMVNFVWSGFFGR